MKAALDAIAIANRRALEMLEARERLLTADEKRHTDALTEIENARRQIAADREAIEKAHAAYVRAFAVDPEGQVLAGPARDFAHVVPVSPATLQSRARIGPQRYAMFATLRIQPMTVEELAAATKLDLARVREQMRADSPTYVTEFQGFYTFEITRDNYGPPGPMPVKTLHLTKAAVELLDRFESYRKAQGKPLPSLTPGDASNSSEDDQEDPADVARSSS